MYIIYIYICSSRDSSIIHNRLKGINFKYRRSYNSMVIFERPSYRNKLKTSQLRQTTNQIAPVQYII